MSDDRAVPVKATGK
jgi:hypothetical protein